MTERDRDMAQLGMYWPRHSFWAEFDRNQVGSVGLFLGVAVVVVLTTLGKPELATLYCLPIVVFVFLYRHKYAKTVDAAWETMRKHEPERYQQLTAIPAMPAKLAPEKAGSPTNVRRGSIGPLWRGARMSRPLRIALSILALAVGIIVLGMLLDGARLPPQVWGGAFWMGVFAIFRANRRGP